MMILDVPVKWLRVQQGGALHLLPFIDFIKAVREGEDTASTVYAKAIQRIYPDDHGKRLEWRRQDALKPSPDGPLPVFLDANGRFVIWDGHHRAASLIVDGATSIQVDVLQVHPLASWLATELEAIYGSKLLYQEIEHPWFDGWDLQYPGRLEIIVNWMRKQIFGGKLHVNGGQNALDVGCCTGRATRELAALGFQSYGIDLDPHVLRIAGLLDIWCNANRVMRWQQDVLAWQKDLGAKDSYCRDAWLTWPYEVVLMLGMVHHWVGPREIERAERFIKTVAKGSRLMIVELPGPDEAWFEQVDRVVDVRGWIFDLLKLTCEPEVIYEGASGRQVIAIWREQ